MSEQTVRARLEQTLEVMCELARGRLDARTSYPDLPEVDDPELSETLDGIAAALDMLAEEFQAAVVRKEQYEATVRELEQTQLQLLHSAKLASLGELAAGVAHELTQPLQIIGLSVDEIHDAEQTGDRTSVGQALGIIEGQVARSAGVIGRLLAFSRTERDSGKPRTRLNEAVTEAVGIWGAQLSALGIELSTDLALGVDDVECDHNELLQVITNLVINARDAVKGCPERRICLRTTAEDEFACIEVTDTGGGIAPADLPRVFDPFFTTKPQGKGTGLGLSVSHGIIRRHGGTIEAFSELEHGTRMRVMLPIVRSR